MNGHFCPLGERPSERDSEHFAKRPIIGFRLIVRNAGDEKRFVGHIRKKIGCCSENIFAFFFRINKIVMYFDRTARNAVARIDDAYVFSRLLPYAQRLA